MSKTRTIKAAVVCMAAAGLVAVGYGSVDAGQSYSDSNVGISSAFERYAESVTGSVAAETEAGENTETATEKEVAEAASAKSAESVKRTKNTKNVKSTKSTTDTETSTENTSVKYPEFEGKCIAVADDYVNIRSEAGTDSEVIGIIYAGGLATVEEKADGWTKVTSGDCTGYINNDYLKFGDDAGEYAETNCSKLATVTTETLYVRAEADKESDCVTLVGQGQSFSLVDEKDGWYQIAVDDQTNGYISADYAEVTYDLPEAKSMEQIEQEQAEREAEQKAAEQENTVEEQDTDSSNSTQTDDSTNSDTQQEQNTEQVTEQTTEQTTEQATEQTTEQATEQVTEQTTEQTTEQATEQSTEQTTEQQTVAPSGQTGIDLANYATQFVGNPYVYGGSSLTDGADCSGFVMAVYAQFGYSLPHSAGAQSGYGTSVTPTSDYLEPGDILFYGDGGTIGHCAIYIGGGMIVHASTPETGIKTSVYNYRTPMCAVRLIGQ